jgi:diaminopimelate epimerase
METIRITKMEGLGNDFVIVDYSEYEKTGMELSGFAKKICDRHFGIGADGLIVAGLQSDIADTKWLFYNADGTTAQMCGNGMRCFAKYAHDKGIVNARAFSVETGAGIIKPEIIDDNLVKVNMGTPVFEDAKIPFRGERAEGAVRSAARDGEKDECPFNASEKERKIQVLDREFEIFPVSMGNPHCVIFCGANDDPLEMAKKYGPELEKHPFFPEKTNVEFVKILSRSEIDMRVFERGCGITLACGTGACASVTACVLNNLTEGSVKVNLLGGPVSIEWQGSAANPNEDIFMTGTAKYVFTADYML